MSGVNIVADTSMLINMFNGNDRVKHIIADKVLFISVVTEIELLSFPGLTDNDKQVIRDFLFSCFVIDIEPGIKEITIDIRSTLKVKLPDAVIAATAIYFDIPLYTMDKGFSRIDDLQKTIISP